MFCRPRSERIIACLLLMGLANADIFPASKTCRLSNGKEYVMRKIGEVPEPGALAGVHLRVGFTSYEPFVNIYNGTVVGGHDVEVFDALANYLGFTYEKHVYSRWENETVWDKTLKRAASEFDVLGQWWFDTAKRRSRGLVIGNYIVDVSEMMITAKPQSQERTVLETIGLIFVPFTGFLWFVILMMIVLASLMMYWLEKDSIDGDFDSASKQRDQIGKSIWIGLSALTGQAAYAPVTAMGMLFSIGFSFSMLVVVACYTANLSSFLVGQQLAKTAYNNIDEVLAANKYVCVIEGAATLPALMRTYRQLAFLSYPVAVGRDIHQAIMDGHCVAGVSGWAELELMLSGPAGCDLQIVGSPLATYGGGFAANIDDEGCKAMLMLALDTALITLEEEDMLQDIWKSYTKRTSSCANDGSDEDETMTSMTVADMSGLIIILALCGASSFVGRLIWRVARSKQAKTIARTFSEASKNAAAGNTLSKRLSSDLASVRSGSNNLGVDAAKHQLSINSLSEIKVEANEETAI